MAASPGHGDRGRGLTNNNNNQMLTKISHLSVVLSLNVKYLFVTENDVRERASADARENDVGSYAAFVHASSR